jgi:hypothetical protein
VKRPRGRKTHRRPWTAVDAQIRVAHRVSIQVANRHCVIARCYDTDGIELESTIIAAHIAHLGSAGARRTIQNDRASLQRIDVRLRFIRYTHSGRRPEACRRCSWRCRRGRRRRLREDVVVESHQRNQNERAPEKVRVNGGINLFFHCGAFVIFRNSENDPRA